jgi:hypothetical protein
LRQLAARLKEVAEKLSCDTNLDLRGQSRHSKQNGYRSAEALRHPKSIG